MESFIVEGVIGDHVEKIFFEGTLKIARVIAIFHREKNISKFWKKIFILFKLKMAIAQSIS